MSTFQVHPPSTPFLRKAWPGLDVSDVIHLQSALLVLLVPTLAPVKRWLPRRRVAHGSLRIGGFVGPWVVRVTRRRGSRLSGVIVAGVGRRHYVFNTLCELMVAPQRVAQVLQSSISRVVYVRM